MLAGFGGFVLDKADRKIAKPLIAVMESRTGRIRERAVRMWTERG
jgi:hypothetical protein